MSVLTAGASPQGTQRYRLATGLEHMTPAERAARGKEARAAVPREGHAVFDPPPDRPDPIGLLEEQAQSRVPELVPVRWGRMMVSPFTFYRGAALPMASDLARTPVSGLAVQACGDAHLSNCWSARGGRVCRTSSRSGTAACWCRRSRSTAAPRRSWRRTWRTRPRRASRCSCAATPT